MLSDALALAEHGRRCNIGFVKDTFFGGAEKKAAKAQERAATKGAALVGERFEETKGLALPFAEPGAPALQQQAALSGALGPEEQALAFQQFQEDPGTAFLREQGLRLIDTGAAATGQLGGGERLRELTRFSQGLALQDLTSRFGRLGEVAGTGLRAVDVIARAGGAAAGQQAAGIEAAGQARAAGITGQAAGVRGGILGTASLLSGLSTGGGAAAAGAGGGGLSFVPGSLDPTFSSVQF